MIYWKEKGKRYIEMENKAIMLSEEERKALDEFT